MEQIVAKREIKGFRLHMVIGRFTVCSSVGVLPRDETRYENLISVPWSREPSCWIKQTWLFVELKQQYRAKRCIIKVVLWSCAVCDLVSAPW